MAVISYFPHIIRGGTLWDIARAYKDPFAAFREGIANALDQYQHESCKGKEPIVWVFINRILGTITIIDSATGILDTKDFRVFGNEDINPVTGKFVGTQKSNINPDIAGYKHVGKAAFLFASDDKHAWVEYYSNNGMNGQILHMDYNGFVRFPETDSYCKFVNTTEALPHTGLKVLIRNAKPKVLVVSEAIKRIRQWCGMKIAYGAKIYVIDESKTGAKSVLLEKPEGLKIDPELIQHIPYTDTNGRNAKITALLEPVDEFHGHNNIDVYIKGYYVCSIHMAFYCRGWINCDFLDPPISREDYHTDDEFEQALLVYLKAHFRPYIEKASKITVQDPLKAKKIVRKTVDTIVDQFPDLKNIILGSKDIFGIPGEVEKKEVDNESINRISKAILTDNGGDPSGTEITKVGGKHEHHTDTPIKTPDEGTKDKEPRIRREGTEQSKDSDIPSAVTGKAVKIRKKQKNTKEEDDVMPGVEYIGCEPPDSKPVCYYETPLSNPLCPHPRIVVNVARHGAYKLKVNERNEVHFQDKVTRAIMQYAHKDDGISSEDFEREMDVLWDAFGRASKSGQD